MAKKIYCPKCNRHVANWDGRTTIDIVCICKKCNKRVIYRIETGAVEIKERPPRSTSSGLNFSY